MICLDFSAAFDTVDHTILLSILEKRLGLRETVLHFCKTYLKHRTTKVMINETLSDQIEVNVGVPQGSRPSFGT